MIEEESKGRRRMLYKMNVQVYYVIEGCLCVCVYVCMCVNPLNDKMTLVIDWLLVVSHKI